MGAAHLGWFLVPYSHAIQTLFSWKKNKCMNREHQTCRTCEHMSFSGYSFNLLLAVFRSQVYLVPGTVSRPVLVESGRGCFAGITLPHSQPSPEPELSSPRTSVPAICPQPLCCPGGCRNKLKGRQDCGVHRRADRSLRGRHVPLRVSEEVVFVSSTLPVSTLTPGLRITAWGKVMPSICMPLLRSECLHFFFFNTV